MEISDDKIQTVRENIRKRIQREKRDAGIVTIGWLYDFFYLGIVSVKDIEEWENEA